MGMTVDKTRHNSMFAYAKGGRRRKLMNVAEAELVKAVNIVTSQTSQTKPGVNKGDKPRRMHPGRWADVTSNLVRSISHEVQDEGNRIKLVWGVIQKSGLTGVSITDVVEYAEELDKMNGIKVLAGIEDAIVKRVFSAVRAELKKTLTPNDL